MKYEEQLFREVLRRLDLIDAKITVIGKKIFQEVEEVEELVEDLLKPKPAQYAKGELNMLSVSAGQVGVLFTFTEFDKDGKVVAPSGPISFSSDNPAVATVDSSQQTLNPDNTVTVPVVAVAANPDGTQGVAHIIGLDPASINKVTAADELDVTAVVVQPSPAVSATGVLSLASGTPTPITSAAKKNPLALS